MKYTDDFQVDDHTKFANNYNFVSFYKSFSYSFSPSFFLLFLQLFLFFLNLLLFICVQEYTHAKELGGGQRTEKINFKMKDL